MPFSKAPAVALEIATEVQLRDLWRDVPGRPAIGLDRELGFLRDDQRRSGNGWIEAPRHRAEMATSADEHWSGDGVVDHPARAVAHDARNPGANLKVCRRPLQQIMIELTAADAKAHRSRVKRLCFLATTDHPRPEAGDRLRRSPALMFVEIDRQVCNALRCTPPGAHFVARKPRSTHDDDIEARLSKFPRARRAGRPAADDEHVTVLHYRS